MRIAKWVGWMLVCVLAAQAANRGGLRVEAPWMRATPPGGDMAAIYLVIQNTGGRDDQLLSATSPMAEKVELHGHKQVGGVMQMRAVVGGVNIAPGARVVLRSGGLHLMVFGLTHPMRAGEALPLTLQFARAGAVNVKVKVVGLTAQVP